MQEWIIALVSTIAGTIVGWALQFIKRRKLIFSKITIKQNLKGEPYGNSFFTLKVFNSSHSTRAIRNPTIVLLSDKNVVLEEPIQKTRTFATQQERDETEVFRTDEELIEIPANGNINQLYKIEHFKLSATITKAYLCYQNEKFKTKKVKITWVN